MGKAKIVHGASDNILDLVGVPVESIRLSMVHDLNIPADAVASVNDIPVSRHYRLQANDIVAFFRLETEKGVGDRVWTGESFCAFFGIGNEDLQAWIAQGMKVKLCSRWFSSHHRHRC